MAASPQTYEIGATKRSDQQGPGNSDAVTLNPVGGNSSHGYIAWLDYLRIAAAFAVVCLHVSSQVDIKHPEVHSVSWWFAVMVNVGTRWCVPAFIMISSILLIPKAESMSPGAFYKTRFMRLLWPTLFWSAFYICWSNYRRYDPHETVIALLEGRPYFHLWYLYMLMGLYVAAPFVARFMYASSRSVVRLAIILGFIMLTLNLVLISRASHYNDSVFGMWIVYVPHFMLGHFLFTGEWRPSRKLCLIALPVSMLLTIVITGTAYVLTHDTRLTGLALSYHSPGIVIFSIAIFYLFRMTWPAGDSSAANPLIKSAAGYLLGVYVIHPIWLDTFSKIGFTATSFNPILAIPLLSVSVYLLSLASAAVIGLIPLGKRVVC